MHHWTDKDTHNILGTSSNAERATTGQPSPDEVVHNISGMHIDRDEGCKGAAVQIRQGGPDHAGEGPQLLAAGREVLG